MNTADSIYLNQIISPPKKAYSFLTETLYNKPRGISLKKANELLVTFAITRHPFSRLVSGYNQKVKNKVWNSIQDLDIRESIAECLTLSRNLSRSQLKKIKDYARPKEFVEFLLKKVINNSAKDLNIHWRPQYVSCPFCKISFDYVGDIEHNDHHISFLSNLLKFKVCEII